MVKVGNGKTRFSDAFVLEACRMTWTWCWSDATALAGYAMMMMMMMICSK